MDEIFCEDCGARFRNECHCEPQLPISDKQETWYGIDGHKYVGDPKRASLAYHADDCRCYTSEDWY